MPCEQCSCHEAVDLTPSPEETGLALTRRDALVAGLTSIAVLAVDRLTGGSAAFARTLRKTFHPPAGSRKVGNLKHLRSGAALATVDPRTGRPAVIVRPSTKKQVVAYSAVCTHAGCTVSYNAAQKLLVCPCHGSVFNPTKGAAVVSGPAPSPLPKLKVAIDPKGNIWLV